MASRPETGMKSCTSHTPVAVMNRVIRIAVSGWYICWDVYGSPVGRTRKWPPRSSSSRAPNTLGESKRGQQNQSIDPSVVTSAAVCRSPISPWSAMAVSVMVCRLRGPDGPCVVRPSHPTGGRVQATVGGLGRCVASPPEDDRCPDARHPAQAAVRDVRPVRPVILTR